MRSLNARYLSANYKQNNMFKSRIQYIINPIYHSRVTEWCVFFKLKLLKKALIQDYHNEISTKQYVS